MDLKNLEKINKAIGNNKRLLILQLLKNGKRKSVSWIAEKLKLSIKSTSKHLLILKNVNLLDSEQESLVVFYFLNKETPGFVKELLKLL